MLSAALWQNSDQGEECFVVRVCKDGGGGLRSNWGCCAGDSSTISV